MAKRLLRKIYRSFDGLCTENGINASGKEEVYGCIFGRDSAITILKILKVLESNKKYCPIELRKLKEACKKGLLTLTELQGKTVNIESGEEPGKFIHEYRTEKYERLLQLEKPWFVYPDGILRNYDSIDSTPLALIAIYKYWKQTNDGEFLIKVLPSVEKGLNWIITFADKDKDNLIEYEIPKERKSGGLRVQSWTDSHESITQSDGKLPSYPIAPVEAQGYAWLALKLWANFYKDSSNSYSRTELFGNKLSLQADLLKNRFNDVFLFKDGKYLFPAQALDGKKRKIRTVTGNALLLLWASYKYETKFQCVLDDKYLKEVVERSFKEDLFDKDAGIRTMSLFSSTYNPNQDSYHNGSFWPKLNGMAHEGLENMGFKKEAKRLRKASIKPIKYFQSPIELYIKGSDGSLLEYKNKFGQSGCKVQAWSAAAMLDLLTL